MATTQTPNAGLLVQAEGDLSWDIPITATEQILDGLSAIGGLATRTNEYPSTSKTIAVAAGAYRAANGTVATYAGGTVTLTASMTSYVYLSGGTLTVSTTGWPSTPCVRLASVVVGASTITAITDARVVVALTVGSGYTAAAEVSGYTAGTSTAVTIDGTFTGGTGTTAYTIGDIVAALKAAGIIGS